MQAGRGSSSSSSSSSPEELVSDWSSSTSSSFKDSSLSQLSSPPAPEVSSSPVAETDSLSLVPERAQGLVGEVTGLTGLEAVQLCTGGEMTKERLLVLWKEGRSNA